jgi:hypothetical protein
VKMEAKSLQDEFVSLKKSIEGEIDVGQKSIDDLNDITTLGMVLSKGFAIIYRNIGSDVVGCVDDF